MESRPKALGLAFVICGVQFSALANATVKLLAAVPMLQIMQLRFLLQWTCSLSACVLLRFYGHPIRIFGQPGHRIALVAQGCATSGALGLLWGALRYLPVGEVTAIAYLNPVVCGLLASSFLGETLTWAFSCQAVVSCIGVYLVAMSSASTVVATTGEGHLSPGVPLALLACIGFASGNCLMRFLKGSHPLEIQLYQDSISALILVPAVKMLSGVPLLIDGSEWDRHQVLLLTAFAGFGMIASVLVILGFGLAPAGEAAPFMYVEVCSSFALQILVFGDMPGACQAAGSLLIILAAIGRVIYGVYAARQPEMLVVGEIGTRFIKCETEDGLLITPSNALGS